MDLINQHTKKIMEGCKERARAEGLMFQDETLEYIVTNKDLLELGPKLMIPTMYDYWVHDIEVLKEKGRYELYPNNPYETVINTRPPISFYNDNNPDWLNVMIFYHVLAHIDFFQNNMLFKHTWYEDFEGRALSDKRFIARLRSEKGREVDYVIEFTRGIDNLVAFYHELSDLNAPEQMKATDRLDFYFDIYLQKINRMKQHEYLKEIENYNLNLKEFGDLAESVFFSNVLKRYPEFDALYEKHKKQKRVRVNDLIQYIQEHSPHLQKEDHQWMKSVMQIVRNTSLFFQPQIRTKILNEGWASYWHEKLFLKDDRIKGNEVGFARVNAKVTALPRIGQNPYALGMRLFYHIEELAEKGKLTYEFEKIKNAKQRSEFDKKTMKGKEHVFAIRENFSDLMFINRFVDQDFVDRHRLFVTGKRLNHQKGVWEYYVRSRDARQYKQMLLNSLYHPPYIEVDESRTDEKYLYLNHCFEGKPLVREYIPNTLLGIEYLWGAPVKLETTEVVEDARLPVQTSFYHIPPTIREEERPKKKHRLQRVVYTMEKRELSKIVV